MNSKYIPIGIIVSLIIGFGLPTNAFAANPDIWTPTPLGLSGCPCPTGWILVTNDNPNVASGREYLDAVVTWVEGYDDIDRRVRAPDNTTTYSATGVTPQTSETVRVSNPAAGGWDEYYRTWSISSQDLSGATQGTFFTTAYDWP